MVKIFWSLGGGGINQFLFRHLSDLTEGISSIDHKVLAANGNFSVISGFSIDQIRQKIYWTTFQGRMTPPSNSFFVQILIYKILQR